MVSPDCILILLSCPFLPFSCWFRAVDYADSCRLSSAVRMLNILYCSVAYLIARIHGLGSLPTKAIVGKQAARNGDVTVVAQVGY